MKSQNEIRCGRIETIGSHRKLFKNLPLRVPRGILFFEIVAI